MPGQRIQPRPCEGCGEMFRPRYSATRFCDLNCYYETRKARPKGAAGNRYFVTVRGKKTVRVVQEDGTAVPEHRLVFEEFWGVKLQSWHMIKHINGDTTDNRPDNLILRNDYAMQQLRAGKSITEIGRSICSKGHQKRRRHNKVTGKMDSYCPDCDSIRLAKRYQD